MQIKLKEYQRLVQQMIEAAFSDVCEDVYQVQDQLSNPLCSHAFALPQNAQEAMRWSMGYVLLSGGKRLRPVLALATYELCRRRQGKVINYTQVAPLVLAIESVHTYSLVHDDLPAMDDDSLRHGLPTVHILWDEAKAILVGDALLTYAFESLSQLSRTAFTAVNIVETISLLARFSGREGMVRGQWRDMDGTALGNVLPKSALLALIREKTACLLQAPMVMMATLCGEPFECCQQLSYFGENLGIAFQIRDDILDRTATTTEMGKTVGKDEKSGKQTYVTRYGLDAAQHDLRVYTDRALTALEKLKADGYEIDFLKELANWLLERDN